MVLVYNRNGIIFPVATYECESGSILQSVKKKVGAYELKCYRKVIRITMTKTVKMITSGGPDQ